MTIYVQTSTPNRAPQQEAGTIEIVPDRSETENFLRVLLKRDDVADCSLTFQVFSETGGSASHFSGTLNDCWSRLCDYNAQGMGIFLMVNEGDLSGRSARNVRAVRAVFLDLDGASPEPLQTFVPAPNIAVETSKDRFHFYWIIDDCPLKEFKAVQSLLAAAFDGDKSVNDLPRVMRLPGFYHQKGTPFLTRVKKASPGSCTLPQLRTALQKLISERKAAAKLEGNRHSEPEISCEELGKMLKHIPASSYDTWIKVGMAIHHSFPGGSGFRLWDGWSQTAPNYKTGETAEKWKSFGGGEKVRPVTIRSLIQLAKKHGYSNGKNVRHASHEEYIKFVLTCPFVRALRRDILSDDLMCQGLDGRWEPTENHLRCLQAYALERNDLKPHHIELHLARYRVEAARRLLIDIPEWDRHDRIEEISKVVRCTRFSERELYELLLAWLSSIFVRLKDPSHQSPAIILKGPQGVGKNTLVNALCGGLGRYMQELDIESPELERQLHLTLVCVLNELDRILHLSAKLKQLLTKAYTFCRMPYDRRAQERPVHTSFIATCNIDEIFHDYTGNRRFWPIEIEYAGFKWLASCGRFETQPEQSYPGMYTRPNHREEQLQILAQALHFAQSGGFKPAQTTLDKMAIIVADMTPPNPLDEAVQDWNELATDFARGLSLGREGMRQWLTNKEIKQGDLLGQISRSTGLPIRKIKDALKLRGYQHRQNRARGYRFEEPPADGMDAFLEDD